MSGREVPLAAVLDVLRSHAHINDWCYEAESYAMRHLGIRFVDSRNGVERFTPVAGSRETVSPDELRAWIRAMEQSYTDRQYRRFYQALAERFLNEEAEAPTDQSARSRPTRGFVRFTFDYPFDEVPDMPEFPTAGVALRFLYSRWENARMSVEEVRPVRFPRAGR